MHCTVVFHKCRAQKIVLSYENVSIYCTTIQPSTVFCTYKDIYSKEDKKDKKLTQNDHIRLLCITKKYKLCMVNINTAKNQHKNIRKKYFLFSRLRCTKKNKRPQSKNLAL